MIISHRHRYLFVETPHTGTTAIAHELVANYGGAEIIGKHASYAQFARRATPDERRYFVFAGMRHPMDTQVTLFYRIARDLGGQYAVPRRRRLQRDAAYEAELDQFRWIRESGADFARWFMNHAWLPYDDWMSADQFGGVIRFEHLQADFAAILSRLGIDLLRPLPVLNATTDRQRDFAAYYPPETRWRAAYVFGPYMRRFGYAFPADWGEVSVPRRAFAMYRLLRPVRAYIRGHRSGVGRRGLETARRALNGLIRRRRR